MFLFPFSFFFFPLPLLPPLSTEQHFPTLLPLLFLLRGRVEQGVREGWGRRAWGRGSAGPRPRGGASPPSAASPSPLAPTPWWWGTSPASPRPPSPRPSGGVPSRNSWGERAQGAPLHPSLPSGPRLSVAGGVYCLGVRQVEAAPRGNVTPNRSRSQRRMPGGMQVPGRAVSFPAWELEFPRMTVGLRGQRDPLTDASRSPFPARPKAGLGRAPLRSLGRDCRIKNGNSDCGNRLFK